MNGMGIDECNGDIDGLEFMVSSWIIFFAMNSCAVDVSLL